MNDLFGEQWKMSRVIGVKILNVSLKKKLKVVYLCT